MGCRQIRKPFCPEKGMDFMKRFRNLVTRLVIVGLLVLAIWIAREPIAKQVLTRQAENYVGAKVEIGQLGINSGDDSIHLGGLEITDPRSPEDNLFQAEVGRLSLDRGRLAWRQLSIPHARFSEVKIGVPRSGSGALPNVDYSRSNDEEVLPTSFAEPDGNPLAALSQKFRDSLTVDLTQMLALPDFEANDLFGQLDTKWNQQFKAESELLSAIEVKLTGIEKKLDRSNTNPNPLREFKETVPAGELLKECRSSLSELSGHYSSLQESANLDRETLSSAQIRDRQQVLSSTAVQQFDGQLLNELLVGPLQDQLAKESLKWFRQFQEAVPNASTDFRSIKRGREVLFGETPRPPLVIQECDVDGEGLFGNQRFKFAGKIHNFSSHPHLSLDPVSFKLYAQGASQIQINGIVDRRGAAEAFSDQIELVASGIEQPSMLLGDAGSLEVTMAGGSQLHVAAKISGTGSEIDGQIEFTFDNVALHLDHVTETAGGKEFAARVNESLSSMRSFKVTSTIGGTMSQPVTSCVSSIGPHVANAFETVYQQSADLAAKKREQLFLNKVETKVTQLNQRLAGEINVLAKKQMELSKKAEAMEELLRMAQDPLSLRRNFK